MREEKWGTSGGRSRSTSAGGLLVQRQVQNGNGGPQQSPQIARPSLLSLRIWPPLRLRPKFRICTGLLDGLLAFCRRGFGGRDAWQRGPEVKDAGREGRCQKPKGATAVTSGSGTVLAARKERRAAWWRRGQGGGRRPELERGHWATDWESHWQQTPGQTDQSEGSAGLKGVRGRT